MDWLRLKDKSPQAPGIFPVRCEDYGRRTLELRAFFDGEHWELIRNKRSAVELKDVVITHWARESSPIVWVKVEERHPGKADVYAVQCKDELGTLHPFTAHWTGKSWQVPPNPQWTAVEITHWLELPADIPSYGKGDPVSS